MIDTNEFFREVTLRLCSHLEIEEGLQACIRCLQREMLRRTGDARVQVPEPAMKGSTSTRWSPPTSAA